MIDRRAFLAGIAGGVALPPAVDAQPPRSARVGVVSAGGKQYGAVLDGLREGLTSAGLEEGKHYTLHVRDTKGELPSAETAAREFEQQGFTVIVAMPSSVTVAVKRATTRIPIVFVVGADPIEIGLVKSHAHPGGRLTGVHSVTGELFPKHLQLLKEVVPGLRRVLTFYDPDKATAQRSVRAGRDAARQSGLTLVEWHVKSVADLRAALVKLKRPDVDGYVFAADAM